MTIKIAETEIQPGSGSWIEIPIAEGLGTGAITIPAYVIVGTSHGPTLWLQGQIHGDEYVAGRAIRDFVLNVDPSDVTGTIVGVPVTNLPAFREQRREAPMDGKDPIRNIPTREDGTTTFTDELTRVLISTVSQHSDYVIDLHTAGSMAFCPGFAIYPKDGGAVERESRELARVSGLFDAAGIDLSKYSVGMWSALSDAGIPSITTETGGMAKVHEEQYDLATRMLGNISKALDILPGSPSYAGEPTFHEDLTFVYANKGGIFELEVEPNSSVTKGETLGRVTDFRGGVKQTLTAPHDARVLRSQASGVVRPGKVFMLGP